MGDGWDRQLLHHGRRAEQGSRRDEKDIAHAPGAELMQDVSAQHRSTAAAS